VSACDDLRHELGAYVLSALAPEEEARVREHLVRCTECRREHGRLTGLVPLLDLAEPGGAEHAALEEPSPLLEDAVLAGFAAQRGGKRPSPRRSVPSARAGEAGRRGGGWWRRRGVRVAFPSALAGAAVAVAALALGGAFSTGDDSTARTTVELRGDAGSARAVIEAAEAGTVIELDARLPPSGRREHYDVVMLSGSYEISAGTFRVGPDGHVTVSLACGGPPSAYDAIVVEREGRRVVTADLPA
jgi:anti-sigma factor RsiW